MAMDWDKLRVFHAVAEAGSFTHAGEALNLSQSAVSRQISALEESLSVPLFHRHARGLILTEQGELLFRTAREVFAKLAMSESLISESKDRPKGPLKITTTVAFGSIWLTPRIREFLDLYPEIQVSLVVDDSELDLSMREADVAIRMSPPRQPDLIQRHLVSVQVHIYGAPEYLKKHGTPQRPEDLDEHRLIIYGEDSRPPVAGHQLAARSRRKAGARPPADPEPSTTPTACCAPSGAGWVSPRCPILSRPSMTIWCACCRRAPGRRTRPISSIRRSCARRSGSACSAIFCCARWPRAGSAKCACSSGTSARISHASLIALRFLQTSQNQFPIVTGAGKLDISATRYLIATDFRG